MTALLLHSVARLFARAASTPAPVGRKSATTLRVRVVAALLLTGLSFGLWRLAFAGLGDGALPLVDDRGGPALLVSEFGMVQDTLWSVSARDPQHRQPLARVPHAPGYGINAALSPDGRSVAYTALPPDLANPSADSPAELWLLDLSTGDARVLAADADLLVAPVWAPDGRSLVFRRSYPAENAAGAFELVRATLDGGQAVLARADAALFPVGFTPDGALLYTQVSPVGTDLGRAAGGSPAEALSHLSDDFTRDWRLSPDSRRLAFLAPRPSAEGMVPRAMVADLSEGAGRLSVHIREADGGPAIDLGPAWHPGGDLTLGRLSPGRERSGAVRLDDEGSRALPGPERGFDVPIAWSPDGRLLAVRNFEGSSAVDPGRARLELVKEDGGRRPVNLGGDVAVVGWLEDD